MAVSTRLSDLRKFTHVLISQRNGAGGLDDPARRGSCRSCRQKDGLERLDLAGTDDCALGFIDIRSRNTMPRG